MIHPRTLRSLEFGKMASYFADLCVSSIGREQALGLAPLADASAAQNAFTLYEQARGWTAATGFSLSAFPDIRGILETAHDNQGRPEGAVRARLDLDAFWALREALSQAARARDSICGGNGATMWPLLREKAMEYAMPSQLLAALVRCISPDGQFKDESSPELSRLRQEIRAIHQSCLRKVKDFAAQYNMLPWLQDEFMTLSSDRYVLPLKANFKGRMQGIIHDWSQSGETCYFEPIFLVEINNHLQELKHEEKEEERKILEYLASLLEAELEGASGCMHLLAQLDILNAKKLFADYLECSCVTFSPESEGISLLGARHPILALARQKLPGAKGSDPVRPLDITLRPGDRILVITGGNAGGKTVCLKTLGLIAALAMSGMPVPVAPGSHLPWFDRMDAFIGDEQSLDENVSTYTAQIDHLAKAWKYLDLNGLVLLDEFGSGTDPAEGAALAQAVLDGLLEKKCFVLSATHFPALKSYALTRAGVRAATMLFDPRTHKPLFRIAYDQVGSSQALMVAREHGLPESILNKAERYLLQDGQDTTIVLAKLNELAVAREREVESLRQQQVKANGILKEKRDRLEQERARLQSEVRAKASELMHAWKEGRSTARQALREMSRLRAEIAPAVAEEKSVLPQVEEFKIGQNVFHALFNKHGTITGIDSRRKRARVEMNGVSLWAEIKDLRKAGESPAKGSAKSAILAASSGPASMSVDVRGLTAVAALEQVGRFLDKAMLAGYSEVEIIHGRGTGALRREINDYLLNCPIVEKFSLAPEDRGGDGMTIVKLN